MFNAPNLILHVANNRFWGWIDDEDTIKFQFRLIIV